jgi:hypothetical protein
MSKKRISAVDEAKRKGYVARAAGVPKKENPYQWNGHLYGYERGPRTWGTLFSDAWFEGWYERGREGANVIRRPGYTKSVLG